MDVLDAEEICMDEVFASLDLKSKFNIDLEKIADVLLRKGLIPTDVCNNLKSNMKQAKSTGMRLLLFHKAVTYLSFSDFVSALLQAEYFDHCEMPTLQRHKCKHELLQKQVEHVDDQLTVYSNNDQHLPLYQVGNPQTGFVLMKEMPKRRLPHADSLVKYYTKFKMLADNNAFERGNREEIAWRIKALDEEIQLCSNQSRKQLLVDKRLELFFLLTQQYADFHERNNVLMQLRDSMPNGNEIDRTAFDIIFHSYMSINCAFRGDAETASTHMQHAIATCETCHSCLPTIVLFLSLQIMNTEGTYLGTPEYLDNVERVCGNAFKVIAEFSTIEEEEETFWKRSVMIQKACSLLGINNYCKIRRDFKITDREIIKKIRDNLSIARNIRGPIQVRRKMFLYYCIGRFHDMKGDRECALKYVRKARALEDKGCFDDQEKLNMREYEALLEQSGLSFK